MISAFAAVMASISLASGRSSSNATITTELVLGNPPPPRCGSVALALRLLPPRVVIDVDGFEYFKHALGVILDVHDKRYLHGFPLSVVWRMLPHSV